MDKPPNSRKRIGLLELDPNLSLSSVQHALKPQGAAWERAHRINAAPAPAGIPRRKSRQLKMLRAADVWKHGTRDAQVEQMSQWFPDIPRPQAMLNAMEEDLPEPTKGIKMASLTINRRAPPVISPHSGCPASHIGTFGKLPGELRNRIYRLAFVQDTPIEVSMEPGTCSQGACLHSKLALQVPGISNTCRQLRWEVMPIFCAENVAFEFDDGVVQQGCVANYLRSLGPYADLIPQLDFLLKRPLWNNNTFAQYATYRFSLVPPVSVEENSMWKLTYKEEHNHKICECGMQRLVSQMNGQGAEESVGKAVMGFVDSEDWSDFVWRVRKTKQWPGHLARCKVCGEVVFNS